MKYLPISLALLCLSLWTISCENAISAPDASEPEQTEDVGMVESTAAAADPTADTISLNTFNTWKENWKDNSSTWIANNRLTAFNLPLLDLENVLAESPDSSRFYIGLESDGNGGYNAKLMVVGVKDGKDMIDYAKGNYVYDVSTQCPPYCSGN